MPHNSRVTFRFAAVHDVEIIRMIEAEAGQRFVDVDMVGIADAPPMDAELVSGKIAAQEIIVASDSSGAVVGFVMFEPEQGRFYIQELDVLTSHAGQRIGAALIEQVARLACERNAMQLTLSTFRDVPWNAPYYRRLGFRDLAQSELDAAMIVRRNAHIARGLDESKRVFMLRELI